jgi:hypothetical protein
MMFRYLTQAGPLGVGLGLIVLLGCLTGCSGANSQRAAVVQSPQLRFNEQVGVVEVTGLPADLLAKLSQTDLNAEPAQNVLRVYVADAVPADWWMPWPPGIIGTRRVVDRVLRFEPRYPFVPGQRYVARFDADQVKYTLPGHYRLDFSLPKPETPPTVVEQVYPTRNLLPENQLKFYIHFSGPMSRGEAYEHIQLLDAKGKPIDAAFLELGEELWDPAGKRFTLLFDPGRIKHGLKPREDLGPVLENGKSYTLVIGQGWHDANGNPLKEPFRKSFKVGPPFEKPVDPKTWKVEAPAAGKSDPLTVTFPVPHDNALLLREVWVTDADGKRLPGSIKVTAEETRWQFTPETPWKAGAYKLVAKTTLEDLAGNKVGRLFEVDEFGPIQKEVKAETVEVTFEVQ